LLLFCLVSLLSFVWFKNTKKIDPTIVVISVGAIIDMKEGTIRYQFPLKKGMDHFLNDLDASSLENT
jgi:hypothetical protein